MEQTYINWLLGVFGTLIGFLLNSVWQAVKDLQAADKELTKKISEIEVLVAGDYIKKDEFITAITGFSEKLDRLHDKLDNKADKL